MAVGAFFFNCFIYIGNYFFCCSLDILWPPAFFIAHLSFKSGRRLRLFLSGSTQSAYNDIDKAMLSHYGMNVANGIYSMAYRIMDISAIPVTALDAASLPRFFRLSREGFHSVASLSVRLAKRAVLLGVLISVCVFAAAPLVPHIVGNGFKESVLALRWLCLIPVFRGIHQLTGSAITGLGFQRYRTAGQFSAAILNLGLNLWLIPQYGWLGAAWASLATDGSLSIVNSAILKSLQGRYLSTPISKE